MTLIWSSYTGSPFTLLWSRKKPADSRGMHYVWASVHGRDKLTRDRNDVVTSVAVGATRRRRPVGRQQRGHIICKSSMT
jgi:hypothetical protein